MTVGRPMPQILRFALPLMLGNLLLQAYSLVDATIVGRVLGIGPLAAIGASSSVLFMILGFSNGCS
ncbi:MAG: MATE family efflux transporter, partial [Bacteroidaceae bacterium]|nr:MATE family efflux transporter [Bacteroidaceae bacterium]